MKTKIKIRNRITHMWLSAWIDCTVTFKKKINSEIKQLDLVPMCSYVWYYNFINRLNF